MAPDRMRPRRWARAEYDRLVRHGILHEDERVELIAGRIVVKGRYPVLDRAWSATEHAQLVPLGLPDPREGIELLGGELVCREPQGSLHATAVDLAADALRAAFASGWIVRTEKPLAPEPDVAVIAGSRRDYRHAHPARATLVVEVAESSLDGDRRHKGSLYARAGVPEYWIVDLAGRAMEVYREPEPDASTVFGWRYRHRVVMDVTAAVLPLAAPAARVSVADLLP